MHWFVERSKMQIKSLKGVIKARVFIARALITPFLGTVRYAATVHLYATRLLFNCTLRSYGSIVLYATTVQR
jgi:hypothetical protein